MFGCFKQEPIDWSDVDRLEQRIRDIRERIRRAKSTEKPVLSPHGMVVQTAERLRQSSDELRRSLGEGSEIPQKPSNSQGKTESPAEELKRKLLSKSKT